MSKCANNAMIKAIDACLIAVLNFLFFVYFNPYITTRVTNKVLKTNPGL